MPTTVTDRLLNASDITVWKKAQTTKGTIPTSPALEPFRRRSGRAMKVIGYTEDSTVRADFNGMQQVQDTTTISAEIEASVTKQSINLLLEAIHATEVATTIAASITIAATGTGFTSSAQFGSLSVGDWVWFSGFANSAINAIPYKILTKPTSSTITTWPVPPATESAGASVVVKSNKSFNANTPTYNVLQTRVADLSKSGSIDYYSVYDAVIDKYNYTGGETGIITSKASYVAEQEVTGTALISGQTDLAVATDSVLSAVQNVKDFYLNNVSQKCSVKSLNFDINNNYAGDNASACSMRYTRGVFQVGGSIDVRSMISSPLSFRDYAFNGTRNYLGFRIQHSSTEETIIVFPQVLIDKCDMDDSNGSVANSKCTFKAEMDATTSSTIQVYKNW